MSAIKTYFEQHDWPWYTLSALCVLLGCWLFMARIGACPDTTYLNTQLVALDEAMANCCRCTHAQTHPEEVVSGEEIDNRRNEAGGNIGAMSVSLAWNTTDDLDLFVTQPNGERIYFKKKRSSTGGVLDIDRNAENSVLTYSPVENIYWDDPQSGNYKIEIWMHQRRVTRPNQSIPVSLLIQMGESRQHKNLRVNGVNQSVVETMHVAYPPAQ